MANRSGRYSHSTSSNPMTMTNHRIKDKDKDKDKEDIFTLKSKLNELERQLNEYKNKFEELRRAKTTKLIKFEKEYFDSTKKEKSLSSNENVPCRQCPIIEEQLENEKQFGKDLKKIVEEKKFIDEENDQCLSCLKFNEEIQLEKYRREQIEEEFRQQKLQREKEKRENEKIQQIFQSNEDQLMQMKSFCEALRLENEDYQFQLLKFDEDYQKKILDLQLIEDFAKEKMKQIDQMNEEFLENLQLTNEYFRNFNRNH